MDNLLAQKLSVEVFKQVSKETKAARRSNCNETVCVEDRVLCSGRTVRCGAFCFDLIKERVSLSDPDAFGASICEMARRRLLEEYHVDPSGGKVISIEVVKRQIRCDDSWETYRSIRYKAENSYYVEPTVI